MNKIPVFDIGDTLIPDNSKINEFVSKELERNGQTPVKMPINSFNVFKTEEVARWLDSEGLHANPSIIKEKYEIWAEKFLKEEIIPELKKIDSEFGPIGFISDNSIEAKKFYTKVFSDAELDYKGLVVSEEVGVKKPNEEIFEAFLSQRDEERERFAYFGNNVDRDLAAEKTEMSFVWVNQYCVFGTHYSGLKIKKVSYNDVKAVLRVLK